MDAEGKPSKAHRRQQQQEGTCILLGNTKLTCSKEDLSLHFIACDGIKLVVLEDGMGDSTDRIKLDYLI